MWPGSRILAWNPAIRSRQAGGPSHMWHQKVAASCRYNQLGHWLPCARGKETWLALRDSCYKFCMVSSEAICKYRPIFEIKYIVFWFTACPSKRACHTGPRNSHWHCHGYMRMYHSGVISWHGPFQLASAGGPTMRPSTSGSVLLCCVTHPHPLSGDQMRNTSFK